MERLELDGWSIECDPDSTRAAYALVTSGAHDCSCFQCRNFIAVRDPQYPPEFLEILNKLGITPHKEFKVYACGPGTQPGTVEYAGWYHFIGKVLKDSQHEIKMGNWLVSFQDGAELGLKMAGLPLVQLDFRAELPWVLHENWQGK